jgi:ATP-dependent RNA helicase DDX49/DBP8
MESSNAPPLFAKRKPKGPTAKKSNAAAVPVPVRQEVKPAEEITSFEGLGLTDWLVRACRELGMKRPTPVQQGCVPQILAGKDVFGLAQTGSGKTAAFALPILQRLAENPYGVFALVLTPTRELAFQINDQFKALGAEVNLRSTVVVGGMDMTEQAKALMQRPHVVISTPGRLRDHLMNDPGIPAVFARTKVLRVCCNNSNSSNDFLLCFVCWE